MSNSKIKVIIFGTGEYYKRYNKWLELADIVALLDNDSSVQGTFIDGVKVYSPGEVSTFDYDYIYILSLREKEMRSQLLRLGVKSEKIKSWKNFIIDYQYYANKKIFLKKNKPSDYEGATKFFKSNLYSPCNMLIAKKLSSMNYVNGCFQYWSRQSTVAVKKKIYTRTDTWDFFRKDSLRIILTAVEITIMWRMLTKYFYHKTM